MNNLPTVAELKAQMYKCQVCNKRVKTERGLKVHLRTSDKCVRIQVYRKHIDAGDVTCSSGSMLKIADELGLEYEPSNERKTEFWIPAWFSMIVRKTALELWNIRTPYTERVGPRWKITELLREEYARTVGNQARQDSYRAQRKMISEEVKEEKKIFREKWHVVDEEPGPSTSLVQASRLPSGKWLVLPGT